METFYGKLLEAYNNQDKTYGKLDIETYPWIENFTKECPECHGDVSVFFTDPEHNWAESKCEDCGKVISPYIEVSEDSDESSSEDYFEVYIEKGDTSGTVSLSKEGSTWYERVIDGDLDKSLFNKTYQGYLTKDDIMTWLYKDNFDKVKLVESNKLTEADTNYNTVVNDIVKVFIPYVDQFKFEEMKFIFNFKKFDKETVETIQEKYKEDLENLRSLLAREGLNLEVADSTVIISSK